MYCMQGVPKDFTSEGTLRACLGEIDRCYNENIMPFFVNMTRFFYRLILLYLFISSSAKFCLQKCFETLCCDDKKKIMEWNSVPSHTTIYLCLTFKS